MRRAVRGIGLLALVYAGIIAVLAGCQRMLLYHPDSRALPAASAVLPGAEDLSATTADGLDLRGWYLPPRDLSAGPVILYFHGNAGSIRHRVQVGQMLARDGAGVLLAGYRGYGGNPGSPSEAGLIDDARAWRQVLADRGIAGHRIAYYGQSLGSGVAVALATEVPPAALVLEAPYTSIAAVAAERFPWAPVDALIQDRYDTVARIGQVSAPLLVVHGTEDRLIPPAHGAAVAEAAGGPAEVFLVPGARHNSVFTPEAAARTRAFVARHAGSAP